MSRFRNTRKSPRQPTTGGAADFRWIAYLGLAAGCMIIYGQAFRFQFLPYDDNVYLTGNPHVSGGLTWKNVVWAFTSFQASNWVPLTWLSHMLDFQVFGFRSGAHHLVNVLLHTVNAVLLLWVLMQLDGGMEKNHLSRCLWAAAIFAFHPLHVQSVAWVSQRKDTLSLFFALLALGVYVSHIKRPGPIRYVCLVLCYALSLMAKPMMVTLPLLLLLLDYWPLKRFHGNQEPFLGRSFRLSLEKWPLFLVASVIGIVAMISNRHGGRIEGAVPFCDRVAVAVVAYGWYMLKTLFPSDLAAMYPYPIQGIPWWIPAGSASILLAVTFGVLMNLRRRPYLFVGWSWYLVTVLPIAGLVQIHLEPYADRYSYVPLLGLFLMAAWGIPEIVSAIRLPKRALAGIGTASVLACLPVSFLYASTWRDGETLFNRAVRIAPGNPAAYVGLGNALVEQERYDGALQAYEAAYRLAAGQSHPLAGLAVMNAGLAGAALSARSDDSARREQLLDDSLKKLKLATGLRPAEFDPWYNLGNVLSAKAAAAGAQKAVQVLDEACDSYKRALTIRAGDFRALHNWGNALQTLGQLIGGDVGMERLKEAVERYQDAIDASPDCVECYGSGGAALILLARMNSGPEADRLLDQAEQWLMRSEELRPGNGCYNLACLKAIRGDAEGCREWLEKARKHRTLPTPAQILADPDLSNVRQEPWFAGLVRSAQK